MLLQILLTVVVISLTRVLWRRWKYDLHKIPSPPGLPVFGHMFVMGKTGRDSHFAYVAGRLWNALGHPKLMQMYAAGHTLLFVSDMDFIKNQLMSKAAPFPKRPANKAHLYMMLGNDKSVTPLLESPGVGSYVKAVRSAYASGLQSSVLRSQFPKLKSVISSMMTIIEAQREKGPIDFQKLSVQMTLDAIGIVSMDLNLGGLDGTGALMQLLLDAGYIIFERRFNLWKSFLNAFFPNAAIIQEENKTIDALTAEWDKLTEEISARDDSPENVPVIWRGLKRIVDPETGKRLTNKKLRAEIATLVLAGMDTTGHQLAWILSLLATYPDVTATLMDELESHGLSGKDAREIYFEDLSDLKYLTAVIKEGMRIALSISAITFRLVPKDMTILGYRVPEGCLIACLNGRWMDAVEDWGDPGTFRPERWLTDEDMSQKYQLGFSYGPRDCVGQRLALMELRVAVVEILKRYTLEPVKPFDELAHNCRSGVAVEAKDGIWLHISPRNV